MEPYEHQTLRLNTPCSGPSTGGGVAAPPETGSVPEPEPTFLEGLIAAGLLLQGHVRVDVGHLLLVLHDLLRLRITEHSARIKGLFTERPTLRSNGVPGGGNASEPSSPQLSGEGAVKPSSVTARVPTATSTLMVGPGLSRVAFATAATYAS